MIVHQKSNQGHGVTIRIFHLPTISGIKRVNWLPDFHGHWVDPGTASIQRVVLIQAITKD